MTPTTSPSREVLREFFRMGVVGFGGPSAHLALFRQRFVRELGWLTEAEFVDMLAAANLLPGPTSTEVALAIGQKRAGIRGLLLAGLGFIGPAALAVLLIAAIYGRLGSRPEFGWILYGIQPVVVALVAMAVVGLAPTAIRGLVTIALAVGAALLTLVGIDPVAVIVAGLVAGVALGVARSGWREQTWLRAIVAGAGPSRMAAPAAAATAASSISLGGLFLLFLKVGVFSFGSGYVLLAFLQNDLVSTGLLTNQQLLDAVAVGQVTPGPVYTTATFVGYLLADVPGAVVATVGIFLPAFVGVALVHPLIPRLRGQPIAAAVLDAIGAVAIGLIVAVTIELARSALVDAVSIAIAVVSLAVLVLRPRAAVPLLLGGGVIGYLVHAVGVV